jgi:hypothetical protein
LASDASASLRMHSAMIHKVLSKVCAVGMTLFHCHQQLHMDFGFMALFDCA